MTPDQATEFAARITTAIDTKRSGDYEGVPNRIRAADRERVASDLVGLRQHQPHGPNHKRHAGRCCECVLATPNGSIVMREWPCPDATRYADGLRRTGALYGVTE